MAGAGTLVVLGATGSTGSRIAALAGVTTVVVGRRRHALERLARDTGAVVRVSSLEPSQLDQVFDGATVVVNSVGPYSAFGRAVVEAAIRAGAHYIDFSGEPRWVYYVSTELSCSAQKAKVRLVPSVGLGASGDLAASLVEANLPTVDSLTIAYRIVGMKPSAATARSVVDILAGDAPQHHSSGAVTFCRAGSRSGRLPGGRGVQFPTPDPIVLGARWPKARIKSFTQTTAPMISGPALAATAALLSRGRIAGLARAGVDRWAGGGERHGAGGRATAVAEGGGRRAVARVHVSDVYDFTARAGFAAALGLLDGAGTPGFQAWGQVTKPPLTESAELGAVVGPISSRSL